MFALAVPVIVATVFALARGGSMSGWSQQPVRWWQLAIVALAIQIPLYSAPLGDWVPITAFGPLATVLTTTLVLAMLLRNASGPTRPACLIAASGVALNLIVIVMNGGWMPRADELAPRPFAREALTSTINNTAPRGPETRLVWLGDIIAQPAWVPLANVVSPGDVLLSLGAAYWAFVSTRRGQTT